jgi:hypothetical protein
MGRTRESITKESMELDRKIVNLIDAGQNPKSVAKTVGRNVSTVYLRYRAALCVNLRRQKQYDNNPGSLLSLGINECTLKQIRLSGKASDTIVTLIDLQRFIETNPEWRTVIFTKKQMKDPEIQLELQELEEFARNHGIKVTPPK